MNKNIYPLKNKWTVWIHDLYDKNWNLKSYKKLYTFDTIEDFWTFYKNIDCFNKYMYFLMKNDILPIWENESNINGGAFSYITPKNNSKNSWINLSMKLIGETLTMDNMDQINGASFSPKANICIIKIWNKDCKNMFNINLDDDIKLRYKPHK